MSSSDLHLEVSGSNLDRNTDFLIEVYRDFPQ
jgi:hypothetical protein